jgi:hypothetical protein
MSQPSVQQLPATPAQIVPAGFNLNYFFQQWATLAQVINNNATALVNLITQVGNLPTPPASLVRVTNANGSYIELTDGTLLEWGQSVAIPTGSAKTSVNITFPKPFTTTPVVVTDPDHNPDGGNNPLDCYPTAVTTTGFTDYTGNTCQLACKRILR